MKSKSPAVARRVGRQELPAQILLGLLSDVASFADRAARGQTQAAVIRDYRRDGIRFRPKAWLGHSLTVSDRKAISRATRHLEETGLVVRVTEPNRDRVAFMRPTLEGLRHAMVIAGAQADVGAIALSLRRTSWGVEMARELSGADDPNEVGVEWQELFVELSGGHSAG